MEGEPIDFARFPNADVSIMIKFVKKVTYDQDNMFPQVESPPGEGRGNYKTEWQNFMRFCRNNTPTQDDYVNYFVHLRERGAVANTLLSKFARRKDQSMTYLGHLNSKASFF